MPMPPPQLAETIATELSTLGRDGRRLTPDEIAEITQRAETALGAAPRAPGGPRRASRRAVRRWLVDELVATAIRARGSLEDLPIAAWEQAALRYFRRLGLNGELLDGQDRCDFLQEVLHRMVRKHLTRLSPAAYPPRYVMRVAATVVHAAARRNRRHRVPLAGSEPPDATPSERIGGSAGDGVRAVERRSDLQQLLARLPRRTAEVLRAVYQCDGDSAAAAEVLLRARPEIAWNRQVVRKYVWAARRAVLRLVKQGRLSVADYVGVVALAAVALDGGPTGARAAIPRQDVGRRDAAGPAGQAQVGKASSRGQLLEVSKFVLTSAEGVAGLALGRPFGQEVFVHDGRRYHLHYTLMCRNLGRRPLYGMAFLQPLRPPWFPGQFTRGRFQMLEFDYRRPRPAWSAPAPTIQINLDDRQRVLIFNRIRPTWLRSLDVPAAPEEEPVGYYRVARSPPTPPAGIGPADRSAEPGKDAPRSPIARRTWLQSAVATLLLGQAVAPPRHVPAEACVEDDEVPFVLGDAEPPTSPAAGEPSPRGDGEVPVLFSLSPFREPVEPGQLLVCTWSFATRAFRMPPDRTGRLTVREVARPPRLVPLRANDLERPRRITFEC